MCERCDEKARNPSKELLADAQEQIDTAVQAIALTINMNLGGARGPLEAAIRIAGAQAFASSMAKNLELSPDVRAFTDRLERDYLARLEVAQRPYRSRMQELARQDAPLCVELAAAEATQAPGKA